jgi:hypothetical protein
MLCVGWSAEPRYSNLRSDLKLSKGEERKGRNIVAVIIPNYFLWIILLFSYVAYVLNNKSSLYYFLSQFKKYTH